MTSHLILVVEDNPDNARICEAILSYAGHNVVIADDGSRGLSLIRDLRPSVVLLDIGLPKMDGWEVASAVRQDHSLDHIPLVALTAHAGKENVARARELGFSAFIAKPAEPKVILDVVTGFLNSARDAEPPSPTLS